MREPLAAVRSCALLSLLFVAGLFLPAILDTTGLAGGALVERAYGNICHRAPGRSLTAWGHPLSACARCTGLYLGGALGLALAGWIPCATARFDRRWFFVCAAPVLLDVAVRLAGWPGLSNGPRLITSIPFGIACGVFLADGIADFLRIRSSKEDRARCQVFPRRGIRPSPGGG